MDTPRQTFFARLTLIIFVAACVTWLAKIDYSKKISTDVLDLLPTAEQSPEAGLMRSLASDAQARVLLFALSDSVSPSALPAAARQFTAELSRSPDFAEAVGLGDGSTTTGIGRAIFGQRYALLLPTWLSEERRVFARTGQSEAQFSAWLAERSAAKLENFLTQPEAVPMQDLVTTDPLLLVADFAKNEGSLAMPDTASGGPVLIWARINASPLSEAGQGPVFRAIDHALARVQAVHPGVRLKWSGVNRFAAASRARIESEMSFLNILSILAVLAVGCLLVRRTWKMLHLIPVIVISLLGAWTISTFVFDRIPILVLVIGSLLSGVAIDYGFYIYMQPSRSGRETYAEKLRRLLKPLLASCLTTVIGFSLLCFSDLPLLREVGLFVGAGLLCALAAAMLYFAQLDRPFLESRRLGRPHPMPRWLPFSLLILALAVALVGPWRLRWRDDVRELEIPSPELYANDHALRELFGDRADRSLFITHGATIAQARARLGEFLAYETKTAPQASLTSLGTVFPTEGDWRDLHSNLAALGNFSTDFRAALIRHGFDAAAFAGFFSQWETLRAHPPSRTYLSLYSELSGQLKGPLALLYHAAPPTAWFITVSSQPDAPPPPPELSTIGVNQLETLNSLFTRYRWSALHLSLAGLALVILSVFVIYRGWRAVRIALIPAGSCFFVFGLFGLCGQTLNLFHLLGAFLGVCLSHNYAIFSSETAEIEAPPPSPIRLSALCAATSFGVLSLSRIPVVHALGLTVALIVLTALTVVEVEPLASRKSA